MQKTILLTGATDGIGLAAAKMLASQGHNLLLHGRNPQKLEDAARIVSGCSGIGRVESYLADLSRMADVEALADAVLAKHESPDVLINNAGIFRTSEPITQDGLDVRFAVNTLAPWLLTRNLLPLMDNTGRVVNLSSAAQSPVDLDALAGRTKLSDEMKAYAQSKLAITMWSRLMAQQAGDTTPLVIAVNPGSLLATKMVREGFGIAGKDVGIGADIIVRAALSDEFANASGRYFDNDAGRFADPHPDALDVHKCKEVMSAIRATLADICRG